MIQTNTDYTPKTITNTEESMSSIVYNELFKLDPSDAIQFGLYSYTQNVKNGQ